MKYIIEGSYAYYMEYIVELNDINENDKKKIINFTTKIKNTLFDRCYINSDYYENIDKQIDTIKKKEK